MEIQDMNFTIHQNFYTELLVDWCRPPATDSAMVKTWLFFYSMLKFKRGWRNVVDAIGRRLGCSWFVKY
jgi:hypothetical protein